MLRLRDIMTTDVLCVSPETTLRDAIALFAAKHVSGAPVMAGTSIAGVVSLTDLAEFAATQPGAPTAAAEVAEAELELPSDWIEEDEPTANYFLDMWEDAGAEVATRFDATDGPEWDVF